MARGPQRFGVVALILAIALTVWSTPAMAEPGGGGDKFSPLGAPFAPVVKDVDPENSTNQVISWTTGPTHPEGSAGVVRQLNRRTQIDQLDNQIQVKYYFDGGRTCIGGAPRIQLAIDTDGDGASNGNAFGYLGDQAFGGGCPTGTWVFEDMTNAAAKWDLTQFPGGTFTNTWDQVEAFFAAFPEHRILRGSLVDDACSFAPTACGKAYFDNLVIGNQELDDHGDI